ncbi:MAG: SDR family oxidoreductase [Elusimicrobiota bacterium]
MSRVLIIGASGQVGEALHAEFLKKNNVLGLDLDPVTPDTIKADMNDIGLMEKTIGNFKPQVILCPAAFTYVDGCEMDALKCRNVNVESPQKIAAIAQKVNSKFIYFSSDYIFDGKDGPYDEQAKPNPLSVYGKQKLEMEKFITGNLTDFLIIRTTGVYGPEKRGKNFVLSLIKKLRNSEKIKIPVDQLGTPTYSPNIAEAIYKLIEANQRGVFNVAGSELIGRMAFAEKICEIFDLNKDLLIPVTTEELNQKAKRPLKGGLKIDKLLSTVSIKMFSPDEGLKDLRSKLKVER